MLLNRDRANRIMDAHGLDALVAAFPENIYYLSDYYGPMFLMSRNYTLYAMLPRDEDRPAALVMPGSGVYHLEHAPTWMPNVATYLTRIDPRNIPERDFEVTTEEVDEPAPGPIMPYPTREGVEMAPRDRQLLGRYAMHAGTEHATAARALAGALRTAGLEKARIGFDDPRVCGWLHTLGLEGIAGCDALNIFKQIRMVKSESEIALLRIAGRMSEKAIDTVIDRLEIGMPLDEIGRIHAVAMAQQGGQSEWIIANIRGLATGVVEPNELMKLDSVGSYKQYRGDVGRSVYFGEPTDEMLSRIDAVGRALQIAYEAIRPGKSFKEIVDLTLKAVHDRGFPGFVIAAPHSIGLEHTDHPVSVGPQMPGEHPLAFEENMVFTLDMPYHEFGWGTTHVEDMMIVRKDGCEPITSMNTKLRIKPI
ncbi:M24 family metallopeptidase [Sphingopyxis panaciterrulae]|uniref:Xaa-Pro aminopeptidase n=1 Tax=Sphingopyxis panaciterrulae TaxID=462372 RepID=A0A7W9ES98_9SPHN|nr:M24 family metallopeptidase [Sphingopyxis panaciterrulae]MBB5706965.1 Xaa-Pro aminopeptidase [Sphingopyxis panaciterrulae]